MATLLGCAAAQALAVDVNPPLPTGTIVIGAHVTVTVELARSLDEKVRGLSGRPGLKRGAGMLFVYDRPQPIGIWMKDMRFSLDLLWIREGRVVHIERNAPPLAAVGPERVYTATGDMVLEVPAGFTADRKIKVGDSFRADIPK
jgi:hypothetical protein